jgi:hypothetical protein
VETGCLQPKLTAYEILIFSIVKVVIIFDITTYFINYFFKICETFQQQSYPFY